MPQIRLFTTPACSCCYSLREFLKEHHIEFEEIDVANNEKAVEEMIKKSEQMSVPVMEIDGEIVVGFDKEKISKLLRINYDK